MTTSPIFADEAEPTLTHLADALRRDTQTSFEPTARAICPASDLCLLALLAESHELLPDAAPEHLSADTSARLTALAGVRPASYWGDLLRRAQGLGLLHVDEGEGRASWRVTKADAELLGATRSECFPALLASWLSDHAWASALPPGTSGLTAASRRDRFRLDFVRALGVLTPEQWYRTSTLACLVDVALESAGLDGGGASAAVASALLERVLLVLGAVDIDLSGGWFRLRPGLTLPPLLPHLEALRQPVPSRAERFRAVIEARLRSNDAWTRVACQLHKAAEQRRDRSCCGSALHACKDTPSRIVAAPTTPFRDCLFLARLGRLVHPPDDQDMPGRFVFELDASRLSAQLRGGTSPGDILDFVARRSTDQALLGHLRGVLAALQGPSLPTRARCHDRDH